MVVLAVTAAAAPTASAAERSPHTTRTSSYEDPCEHPQDAGAAVVDLRWLQVRGPDPGDEQPGDTVSFRAGLCRPVQDDEATPVRVDLHPRVDTPDGPDTDFREDPTRAVVLLPPAEPGGAWTWELRAQPAGTVLAEGEAAVDASPVTQVRADVPAELVRAAGDPDDGSRSGLPPLALRACTSDGDCGPGYEASPSGPVVTSATGRTDVDYLPEPRHLPVTYPSVCQFGPLDGQRRPGPPVRRPNAPDRRPGLVPDDPWFDASGPGAPTGQWSLARVGAPAAWDVTTGERNHLVVVVDSGIDGLHPDLRGRATLGRDFVPTRVDASRPLDVTTDTDLGGHGTFVASLVAARTADGVGMASLGWDTGLAVARVFDAESCASDAAVIAAVEWATEIGADAVSLSLGGPEPSEALREAGEAAVAAGTIPVAAAGNAAGARLDYPAAYDAYVSVGATGFAPPDGDDEDPVARYSNRNEHLDLVAPGGSSSGDESRDVLGACRSGPLNGHGWCRNAGTSFATPMVAASLAMARALDGPRTVAGTVDLLLDTARDLTACDGCGPGWDEASGFGRLDTGLAMTWLAQRRETLGLVRDALDPVRASVSVSRTAFVESGAATQAVLARDDVFADALAGAPLAAREGPILLTARDRLDPAVAGELQRVLPAGSTVFLLGGEMALDPAVGAAVRELGYVTARIAGDTRIETASAIARRVADGRQGGQVLVASAANWPDAVAAGTYAATRQIPLVLTWPDSALEDRSPTLLATLDGLAPRDLVLLGGPAAISESVAAELAESHPGTVRRIAGETRDATAAEMVTRLWERTEPGQDDRYVAVDGWRADGWAYGLAASPLGATTDAPMLLIRTGLELDEPARLLRETIGYRLTRPAAATLVGPLSGDADAQTATFHRLGELLGG